MSICTIEPCTNKVRARGMCAGHWSQWRRGQEVRPFKTRMDRFWEKVDKTDSCWLWIASKDDQGYGMFGVAASRCQRAHKWYWEQVNGPVPGGLVLDHYVCDNKSCVNPDHLRPVTDRENTLRSNSIAARNLAKKVCPKCDGEFSLMENGYRYCAPCKQQLQLKHNELGRIARAALREYGVPSSS